MSNCVDAVLASKPAQVAFEKRRIGELEELYGAYTKTSVYQDKITLVDSTNIENNTGPSISKPQPELLNKKRTISKLKTRSNKKPERLEVKDVEGLSFDQKVHTLVGAFGSNNILNFASPGLNPERFQVEIRKIMKRQKFALSLTANEQERQLLIRFSNSKSLEDIESLIKSIPPVPQTALTKLFILTFRLYVVSHVE
ncbi:hypothetical protein BCV72DRAFT_241865 [Rhizopus microsporus var. microsporus]|uniref:Uncharacterized protein n=1 Tax=Rhizopus microsporus var. microsporus TaxID=86635 RepID=A0A1X0R3K2_RHIZD|nr:hypothetical protein BCV72DRAFT_241865 [Rhizopus microsporus var. microsporus]